MPEIVLASSSPYRKALLEQLQLPFTTASPDVDESHLPNEAPEELVKRLALAKARALAQRYPNALIIGSDQVATLDRDILGKPGNRERAIAQLSRCSGREVQFYTGLCLLNTASDSPQLTEERFRVCFRDLTQDIIERYIDKEQPFNCAGSFKSEGLGISLFRKLQGDDPNSLIGLPLIALIDMLHHEGVVVP